MNNGIKNLSLQNAVCEPEKILPVSAECDVLVCGGGIAGTAAALAAARNGAKVLLCEREYMPGGLATAGLVTTYLPICDGCGRQVSFGIAEELLKLSVKNGTEGSRCVWLDGTAEERKEKRYQVQFNANLYALNCESLLLENGVKILYGTVCCGAIKEDNRITHIITENKSGRSAISVKSVIDCTGDADICALAGEDTVLFRQGNLPAAWYYSVKDGKYAFNVVGCCDKPDKYKTPEQLERGKQQLRFTGTDAEELSDITVHTHKMLLDDFLSKGGDGTKEKALACIGTIPQVRMSRRLDGVCTPDDTDMHKFFADSAGLFSDWRRKGPVYELPFDSLRGRKIKNLLTAGRCISCTEAMWDITRVIPVCAVSGEAAGTAAAMYDSFDGIDIKALQQKLRENGVVLHEEEL